MTNKHLSIVSLDALEPYKLTLNYVDGFSAVVDLGEWVMESAKLSPLQDAELFCEARIGMNGGYVEWSDEIDLAADNLRNLAVEQSGGIGHERLWNWMSVHNLTVDKAAQALGLSRRMLMYYRSGEKPIPRTVWLACLGWQAVKPTGILLPKSLVKKVAGLVSSAVI